MLYFDMLEPVRGLSDAERGRLLVAMLEYGQDGKLPQFRGRLALVWGFVKPKIDKDEKEYRETVLKRQFANECRVRKRKGEPEITYDEWLQNLDLQNLHMEPYGTTCTPTTTANATTNTNTTITTAAAAAPTPTACVSEDTDCWEEEQEAADAAAEAKENRKLKVVGGKLGKGVLLLSEDQIGDLLDQMGLEAFDYYTEKLSSFIVEKGAKVASHYETLLRWWRKDSALERR